MSGTASTQRDTAIGALAVAGASLSTYIGAALAKHLFPVVGAYGVTALRVGFAAIMLLVLRRPWRHPVKREQLPALLAYGAMLGLMNTLIYQAFARIPIGIAVGIEVTGPLTIVLILSRRLCDLLWLACAAIGLALLLPFGNTTALNPIGVSCAVGAAICWALYIVFGRRVSVSLGGDGVAWGMVIAAILTVPTGMMGTGARLFAPAMLVSGAVIGCLSSALPYSLEMSAMRRLPAYLFGLLVSTAPAIAALAGLVVLGERMTVIQGLAIGMIVAASAGSAVLSAKAA